MKRGLGVTKELEPKFNKIWDKYEDEICIDRDIETLVPIFRQEMGLKIQSDYSMIEDFVSRYEPNPSIWPTIEYARKIYQTGLLTNMYPKLLAAIYARKDLHIDWGWETIVDSSVVGAQKPEQKIFEIAESKVSCPPSEILFVENSKQHVAAAKSRGWQTFLFDHTNPSKSSQDLYATIQAC
jgi:putative hydrolase of the HAD superfamily